MKIRSDRSICAGHALCAGKAPDVYRLDEEGFCCSDGETVPAHLHEQAQAGARHCPEGAIVLEDERSAAGG
ncbi:MAG: ferredoxin [Betaproteobacteria bacterium]